MKKLLTTINKKETSPIWNTVEQEELFESINYKYLKTNYIDIQSIDDLFNEKTGNLILGLHDNRNNEFFLKKIEQNMDLNEIRLAIKVFRWENCLEFFEVFYTVLCQNGWYCVLKQRYISNFDTVLIQQLLRSFYSREYLLEDFYKYVGLKHSLIATPSSFYLKKLQDFDINDHPYVLRTNIINWLLELSVRNHQSFTIDRLKQILYIKCKNLKPRNTYEMSNDDLELLFKILEKRYELKNDTVKELTNWKCFNGNMGTMWK